MQTARVGRVAVVAIMVATLACGDEDTGQVVTGPSPVVPAAATNTAEGGASVEATGGRDDRGTSEDSAFGPLDSGPEADQAALRVRGELPPGVTRATLEADLRKELGREEGGPDLLGGAQYATPTRPSSGPGKHEITSITSSGTGDPPVYSMTINLAPPSPVGTHTGLLWIDRHDGRNRTRVLRADLDADETQHTETNTITLGREANGESSTATHKIQPGWYVVWTIPRNCNTEGTERRCRRGTISVETHQVEDATPPPVATPGPPSIASTEITSWDCPDFPVGDPCVALVTINLWGVVSGSVEVEIYLVNLGGTPTRASLAAGAARQITMHLPPGVHRSRVRQRRAGGEWSEWLEHTPSRLTIQPDSSVTDGDPPGAPRNVTATKLNDWRWRVSWDGPSDNGGWPVTSYRMGIHGRSATGRQSRTCGGSWPYQNVTDPEDLAGNDGRRYSQVLLSFVPEDGDWKVGVTGVNFRGEGACGSFDPFP